MMAVAVMGVMHQWQGNWVVTIHMNQQIMRDRITVKYPVVKINA